MEFADHEYKVVYRLVWQGTKQTRSRIYARKPSAERKAKLMRADGKECDIETWTMFRHVPSSTVPPVGDNWDRGSTAPPVGDNSDREPAEYLDVMLPGVSWMRNGTFDYGWFKRTNFIVEMVHEARANDPTDGTLNLNELQREAERLDRHKPVKEGFRGGPDWLYLVMYFQQFPEYYRVGGPKDLPETVCFIGDWDDDEWETTRIYP